MHAGNLSGQLCLVWVESILERVTVVSDIDEKPDSDWKVEEERHHDKVHVRVDLYRTFACILRGVTDSLRGGDCPYLIVILHQLCAVVFGCLVIAIDENHGEKEDDETEDEVN